MRHKRFFFLITILSVLSLSAAAKDNTYKIIRAITAQTQTDNSLREDIVLDFKCPAYYNITYWEESNANNTRKTKTIHAETGKSKTTLIFLKEKTRYSFNVSVSKNNKKFKLSPTYQFTTTPLPPAIPTYTILKDSMKKDIPGYFILGRSHQKPGVITIIDTKGNVVWYQNMGNDLVLVADYDSIHHTIQCNIGRQKGDKYTGKEIIVMDLYGNTLLRKDVQSLYVHHEIKRMPDGNLLMVNYVPRHFDLTKQGGTADETVFGDGFTIMDMNGNTIWQWDCFSEVNPQDEPMIMKSMIWQWDDDVNNKKYNQDLPGNGMSGNPLKDDWLHANSVAYDADGNYYISFNNISEVWKINKDTKKVEYRLGRRGNLKTDDNQFMSGVHCVTALEKDKILFLDNGCSTHQSKVLEYVIDPINMKAAKTLEIKLPSELSTQNRGSVYLIENIYVVNATTANAILFMDAEGHILRYIKTPHQTYRAQYVPPFNEE